MTPLGAVARGLAAGVIGTATMTAWQEISARLPSHGDESGAGEDAMADQHTPREPPDPWEQASTPAKVARKVIEGVFDRKVPRERIGLLTNAVHWGYGMSWGALYGLVQGTRREPAIRAGLLFGAGVWTASYFVLVPMRLYQPPWKYPVKELALDVSYHLAYGAGVGAGYAVVDR